jgi:hypothetical protein
MKTAINAKRSGLIAGVAATLAVAAMGFAGAAQARDNVAFSVGIGVPGVQVGVTNAYPVYTQPQPVYVQPAPVYVQPQPVYYGAQPVYMQPQPVYYGRPHGRRHHDGGYYVQAPRPAYGPAYGPGYGRGYAPVYYRR